MMITGGFARLWRVVSGRTDGIEIETEQDLLDAKINQ
jgi:hypothetical protein